MAKKIVEVDFGLSAAGGDAGVGGISGDWVAALDHLVKTKFKPLGQGPAESGRGNLRGMCISQRSEDSGMPIGEQTITIFVSEKQTEENVDPNTLFTGSIQFNNQSFAVDVVELVEIFSGPPTGIIFRPKFGVEPLPVKCGSCIGNARTSDTGTLGCLVLDEKGKLCILSNNHVIGGSNTGQLSEVDDAGKLTKKGDEIHAPGKATRFPDPFLVGHLLRFEPIAFDGKENTVDAALAATAFEVAVPDLHIKKENVPIQISPQMQTDPRIGMVVYKEGAKTGSTLGIIVGLYGAIDIPYPGGQTARFVRQLVIRGIGEPFSEPGDSGALVLEHQTKRPVGLLFAGGRGGDGKDYTFANPIVNVKNRLKIERFLDKKPPQN